VEAVTFITGEMRRAIESGGIADLMRQRAEQDPAFAEDCESLFESMPFMIRYEGSSPPVRCECCGTLVRDPLEAHSAEPRTWKRAIWEAGTGRKHTLRRCNWRRDQALISKSSTK
jgi:hypothetical protein